MKLTDAQFIESKRFRIEDVCKKSCKPRLCYVTDDLLQDATALEAIVRQVYADEMSFKIDDAVINGSGVGMPLGILNSNVLVAVPKESGQTSGTIKYENILNMWSSMPARLRVNAVWYINQEIEPHLYTMALNVRTGGAPVFLPSGGASGSQFSTLLNRPIIPIEQCSPLGKKGANALSPFVTLVDR
jgi:HK97 family phage major capsid protein